MSIKVSTKVWNSKLAPTEKFVCLCLADFANDNGGSIFPANDTIAKKTGFDKRTVQKTLRKLIAMGIISQVGSTKHGTKKYQINLHRIEDNSNREVAQEDDDNDGTVYSEKSNYQSKSSLKGVVLDHPQSDSEYSNSNNGVNDDHPGGGRGPSDPSINHQLINLHFIQPPVVENILEVKIIQADELLADKLLKYIKDQLNTDIPTGLHVMYFSDVSSKIITQTNGKKTFEIKCKDKASAIWCLAHLAGSVIKTVRGCSLNSIEEVTWTYANE